MPPCMYVATFVLPIDANQLKMVAFVLPNATTLWSNMML